MTTLDSEHDRWLEVEDDAVVGECKSCEEVIYNSEVHFINEYNEKIHEDCFVEYMMKQCNFRLIRAFDEGDM